MDKEEKTELPHSSTMEETVPLLSDTAAKVLYSQAINPWKFNYESTCGQDSAAAGTSKTCEKDAASSSATDESGLRGETSKKHQETENEEMADHINSYEGMADIVSPSFGCALFYGIWLWMCHFLSSFVVQFPLNASLLALPIAVGFMGAKYLTRCPMSTELPYGMMVLGCIGTLALLVRLAWLLHARFSTDELLKEWLKFGIKVLEGAFLASFIIELGLSYKDSPSDDPFSPKYCDKSFYSFVCVINNVLISLVVVWIFLYFITGQRCMRRAAPS